MSNEEPKLIVDTDWKAQAQAEKERLAATSAPAGPGAARAGKAGAPGADEPVSFDEIVRMLAIQALTFLGEVPDPRSGQRVLAPEYARLYIDMLGVLEEKTKGNLSAEEAESLTATLGDLRMAYVEITKAVAKAVAEGKIKPSSAGGPMGGAMGGPGGVVGPGMGGGGLGGAGFGGPGKA
ncbi:MAG: DUF1844 domain-containing protein [Phycisphaerales bacterium]|nr:MAG: DUF1844 domain-containing protein [Phycisphaerales bacterium]